MRFSTVRWMMLVLLCLSVILLGAGCKPKAKVVPDVKGKTLAQATAAIEAAGYTVGETKEDYDATVPAGQVAFQVPAAGTAAEKGTPVDLTVSLGPKADSTTYDVTYAPETVVVDEAHLGLMTDSDPENHVYTFDAAGVAAAGLPLEEGRPLIIHGVAARRISAVTENGGNLVVETEYMTLNEAITDGTIAWDYGVEFTPEKIAAIEVPGHGRVVPKAATPVEFSFDIGEYNYEIKCTLDNTVATYDFIISKGLVSTAAAKLEAAGKLERFRSKDSITFAGGEPQEFGHELDAMRGDLTVSLTVAASGNDAVNLELPATIMYIPFMVGLVPVELKVKVQFVVNAVVPLGASARVSSKFSYDSTLGFNFDGAGATAAASAGNVNFGDSTHETGAPNHIAANFGLGFPRVELDIFKESVVPWAQTAFLVGGTYTFQPACQTADAMFIGAAGYELGLFGWVHLASGKITLFQEKKPLLRSGDCPADKETVESFLVENALAGYGLEQDVDR